MNEETTLVENPIYYYYNKDGVKFYTPNLSFAEKRANDFGTDQVFIEKN
jgi:hypothetical protein